MTDASVPAGDTDDRTTKRNNRLRTAAAIASITVASVLIATKTGAWLVTGSIAILSTLLDSLLDLAASVVNFVAIRHAMQPPDREHRFGHGKAEALAGMAQAAFISGSAAFLMFEAASRLFHATPVVNSTVGIIVMVLSIVLTLVLVLFQRYVVRVTGSIAVGADSLHYKADLFVNLGVILALVVVTQTGFTWVDPVFAISIAIYIVYGAWGIFISSMNMLMDRELPEADRNRIREIALAHPEVLSVHDLRTRSAGVQTFIQFHLEMDGTMSLLEAHEVADDVMLLVEEEFPDAEVLIHEDPHGVAERRAVFA